MTQLFSPNGTPASRLTFGTMQFGGNADAAQSRAMYDAALKVGITHFDTAFIYTDGASETLLGQMVEDNRDDLVIATKAAYVGGSTRKNILKHFDVSRDRLQMDMVDLLYLHLWKTHSMRSPPFKKTIKSNT
jgi:aryl-alcohol dehydrogenase-like predicted oxidoreductase